jgi:hypothetical protein
MVKDRLEYDRIIQVHIWRASYRFTLSILDACGTQDMKIINRGFVSSFRLYVL